MRALFLPLITSALFAGSFIAGKFTTAELGPLTASLLRYLVAWLFLGALIIHYKPGVLKVARRDLGLLGMLGLSGIAGYHYFFFSSLRYTEVANTAIINATSPVLTAFAASLFLGERLRPRNYLGVALAFAGVIVLLTRAEPGRLTDWRFNTGDLLMLLAVACWVTYSLLLKALGARYASFTTTYYAVVFGTVALALLSLSEEPLTQAAAMSSASWYSVVYMGLFASGLGYLLYTHCIDKLGPTRASGSVYALVPVFVALLAWMFFGQPVTAPMILSIALILAGLRLILKQ